MVKKLFLFGKSYGRSALDCCTTRASPRSILAGDHGILSNGYANACWLKCVEIM